MRRLTALFLALLAVHAFGVAAARAQQVESPGAPETLLKKMEAAYSALQSYSDNSVAIFRNANGTERSRVAFRIWFARPGSVRIDAQSTRADGGASRREVLWSDGEKARAWSSDKPVVNLDKIQIAGSRMFGTYAYHVPTLLERSYGGQKRIHELTAPLTVGEEMVDGVLCHRIRGAFHGDPYELWIGKADHLVRKIVATYSGNQMEEIHREVALNPAIPPGVFQFAPENEPVPPPAKKGASPSSPTPAAKKSTGR